MGQEILAYLSKPQELKYPALPIPDINRDPQAGTYIIPVQYAWLKAVAPQLNLDTPKLLTGYALTRIWDDSNEFGYSHSFDPQLASASQRAVFFRMDWESQCPELPHNIRTQIKIIRHQLTTFDWTKREDFNRVRELWTENVLNFTKDQIATCPHLKSAKSHYLTQSKKLAPYWREFLARS
jgi:hypothetical protein